ncbi:RnfABCDGE type electron transport complex subunit D [Metabacillus sp. RGM 3146]|uniref:RnfABCDGE type electron transport complex subunit D n=1 Tax=Metabacillus sp. RGM 3146 TaxID=3401092 RepID=UPI003B9CF673
MNTSNSRVSKLENRRSRYSDISSKAAQNAKAEKETPNSLEKFLRTPKGYLLAVLLVLALIGDLNTNAITGLKSTGIAVGTAVLLDFILSLRYKKKLRLPDGGILTGLIIALVLNIAEQWYVPAIASAAAILSKHILKMKKKPIFNPAAFGLLAVLLIFSSGQSWWGSLSLLPSWFVILVLIGGYMVTNKVNKFPQVFAFIGTYCLIILIMAYFGTGDVTNALRNPFVNSALFLAFFMVTDPPTSPAKYKDQVLFGFIAATISCADYLIFGGLSYLLIGLLAANAWKAWGTKKKLPVAVKRA